MVLVKDEVTTKIAEKTIYFSLKEGGWGRWKLGLGAI